jgi:hypothetical protein
MRANLDSDPRMSFEQYNELAKLYARYDDGLDDDFVEEEWQFVHEDEDDEDEDEDYTPTSTPSWFVDDEEDEDDEDYEDEDDEEDDDQDWDAGTEDYEDEDDEDDDDWYEADDPEE